MLDCVQLSDFLQALLLTFVPIFVAMDGIGTLPVFIALTQNQTQAEKRKVIRDSVLTAFLAGLAFLLLGKGLFNFLGITFTDFKIAGGALLFVLALSDLLQSAPKQRRKPGEAVGIVPIGIPLVVGPAVLTSLLILTDAYGLAPTVLAFLLNVLIVWGMFALSDRLLGVLGGGGVTALSKLSNLLLAAIAVMMLRKGIEEIIKLWSQ